MLMIRPPGRRTLPCSAMIRFTPETIDSSSVTSMANTCAPASANGSIRSTRRAAVYTVKPASSSSRTVHSPMPDEPPVTSATLPLLSMRKSYRPGRMVSVVILVTPVARATHPGDPP
jgi:hypothetical protein